MVTLDSKPTVAPLGPQGPAWPLQPPHPFFLPSLVVISLHPTCFLAVLGGCQRGSYLSAFAPALSTGQAALPFPPLHLSGLKITALGESPPSHFLTAPCPAPSPDHTLKF